MDFLTKKKKINEGEIQQYYIEGSHLAIIQPEFFDLVQVEIKKRKGIKRSTAGIFASMLICGDCGNFYGSKGGTPHQSTGEQYGSAIGSLRTLKNVPPHT